jgi:hypothetical protein
MPNDTMTNDVMTNDQHHDKELFKNCVPKPC